MIESIGLAAAKFAGQYAGRQWLDRRKLQDLAEAYSQSAEEIINLCEQEGYPAKSPVWDNVVSLLRSEERASQVALWYTQGRASSKDLQDVIGDDPTVGHFINRILYLRGCHLQPGGGNRYIAHLLGIYVILPISVVSNIYSHNKPLFLFPLYNLLHPGILLTTNPIPLINKKL